MKLIILILIYATATKCFGASEKSAASSRRTITATVTAYCDVGATSSGKRTRIGYCAGPRALPIGTVVKIIGVGTFKVMDRTARRYDGRYDIWMPVRADCMNFGKQQLTVKIYGNKN